MLGNPCIQELNIKPVLNLSNTVQPIESNRGPELSNLAVFFSRHLGRWRRSFFWPEIKAGLFLFWSALCHRSLLPSSSRRLQTFFSIFFYRFWRVFSSLNPRFFLSQAKLLRDAYLQ